MIRARDGGRFWLWFEYAMGFFVLALIGRVMWVLYFEGYLQQPFFYEPSDTFMDWFNTAYWAHDRGTYDKWGTIYPPLSFVVMRLLGKGSCYLGAEGQEVRDCDWVGLVAIHAIFVMNIILTAIAFSKIDRRTAIPRAIAVSTGMPMMFALERGNIILLCFTAMLLAFGPIIKSARARWFFAGIAVNFKIYLIATIFAQLLRRKWLWAEGALIATVLIYAITYGILGVGTPIELFDNIFTYSTGFIAAQVLDVWYSVTYQPLISMLQGTSFPVSTIVGSRVADFGLVFLPTVTRLGQLSIVLAAVATWLRPEAVPPHRVAFFGVCLALISSEAGGYTEALVLMFVFMESWRGIARPIAIILCYILALPSDIIVGYIPPLQRISYLAGGAQVEVHLGVALGMFLRPGLLILVGVSMSAATIAAVWRDIRHQGWSRRWRYRRDYPLLPGVARPRPPVAEAGAQP
ncbi:hypothetical protein SAMN03159338_4020 [Sphingomonas sp. NFR04]|uniref:hypothetical protein n=1 Tax=Sphingomonas sp. NFR04 TaxID=1566283 RepID=UPI0008F1C1AE|nr:hypothetical protein [Sphingomonas sp. NFR04]SFK36132.1 hypothetical protein SAMN03159338_4020 [Sphingomonas sp. NFR04]